MNYGWIFKLNLLVVGLLLVIYLMSGAKGGVLQQFFANIFGAPSSVPQQQEAGR